MEGKNCMKHTPIASTEEDRGEILTYSPVRVMHDRADGGRQTEEHQRGAGDTDHGWRNAMVHFRPKQAGGYFPFSALASRRFHVLGRGALLLLVHQRVGACHDLFEVLSRSPLGCPDGRTHLDFGTLRRAR